MLGRFLASLVFMLSLTAVSADFIRTVHFLHASAAVRHARTDVP